MENKKMKSGIYKITCLINNKIYIGSAVNLFKRKTNHFSDLNKNKHKNKHLQNAFNKYGIDKFTFEVLEHVDTNLLIIREQFWIDISNCTNRNIGYNVCLIAGSSLGIKHSEETRKRRSQLNIGNKFNLGNRASIETRRRMSESHKGQKAWNKGIPHSDVTKKKIGQVHIGNKYTMGFKYSDESKKKMSLKRIGIKLSDETRRRMSIARMGNQNARKINGR